MAGVSTSLAIQDKFSSTLNRAVQGINRVMKAMDAVDVTALDTDMAKMWRDSRNAIKMTEDELDRYVKKLDVANKKAEKHDDIWSKAKGIIGGIAVGHAAQQLINLADQTTNTNARLSLIVDDEGSVKALQDEIFASAQRSRAAYQTTADAVSKMGIMARDAFSTNGVLNTGELIQFTELINKQFTIAGTNAAGIDAAMLQLTQAMSSGVLRGEELNSIFEQAPTIIQTIADYMDVPVGKIRSMAEEGKITSQIVKNAMLSSADDINERFNSMPMTFAQVWTNIQNMLLKTFNPLIQAVGRGAQWINDNWENVAPVLVGAGVGALFLATALGIKAAADWLAVESNKALVAGLLKNPFLWIAMLIGVVVAAIYKWVQAVGGLKVAWLIVCDKLITSWDAVKIAFMTGVYGVLNMWDMLSYGVSAASTAVTNFMGDMRANVLLILQDMVNGAIDIINSLIEKVNKIPGVNIEAVEKVTFGTQAAIENEAAKAARNQALADKKQNNALKIAERDAKILAMEAEATAGAASRQAEIAMKRAEATANAATDSSSMAAALEGASLASVGEVGKINSDVNIADEDIKLMKDVAEMRYVQNFVTLDPSITMSATVTKDADFDAFYNEFGQRVAAEFEAQAEDYYS